MREQAPRISVSAAIDIDADRANAFSERTGARAFATLDDALVGGDFDAMDIMLPHDLHESAVMQCFDAGKHVLLEKPMAPTLDACARILEAAERTGVVFMVAENAQYWPEVVKAKEVIDSGAIGEPVTARAAFANNPLRDGFFDPDAKSPWRFNAARAGGGITIDGGSHWIRPLRMWLGEIDSVVATTARPLADMQGESLARALLRFRGGITAAFDAIYLDSVFAPDDMWRVTGTTGELTISSRGGGLWLWNASKRRGELLLQSGGYPKSFGGEMKDFAAAVQVSCPASFWYFRVRHARQCKAWSAGNIGHIRKGHNAAVARMAISRRARPTGPVAALRPLAMEPTIPGGTRLATAGRALPQTPWGALK